MSATIHNRKPITWACECGQMNLLTDRECRACEGKKDVTWDREDRKRAVIYRRPNDTEDPGTIVGFE
jgi:hypothetical protein